MSKDAELVKAALEPLIKQIIDKALEDQEKKFTIQNQNLLLEVAELKTQMIALHGLCSGAKKTVTKKKPAKDKDEEQADTKDTAAAVVAAQEDTKAASTFPNIYAWFSKMYKTDEAFRTKYTSADHEAKLADDNDIKTKEKGKKEKNWNLRARKLWGYIKADSKAMLEQITSKYNAAKKEHEQGQKPDEEEKEPVTPK